MILVIGATGIVGCEICQQLAERGLPVRAMVRSSTSHAMLELFRKLGIQTLEGDLRYPNTYYNTLRETDAIICTASSIPFSYVSGENDIQKVDMDGIRHLIHSANKTGVKHFIYTSLSGNIDLDFPLRNAKRANEKQLQQSNMDYLILRPSFFMETWLSPALGFNIEHRKATIYGDGWMPVSYISYKDLAAFAVDCVTNIRTKNITIEFGGPESISQLDAVRIFETVTRRKFELEHIPTNTLDEKMNTSRDPMQKSTSGLMLCLANGDTIYMEKTIKKFNLELSSVKEYANKFSPITI